MKNTEIKNIIDSLIEDSKFIHKIPQEALENETLFKAMIDYEQSIYKQLPLKIKQKENYAEILFAKEPSNYKYEDFPKSIRENKKFLLSIIKRTLIKINTKDFIEISKQYSLDKEIAGYIFIYRSYNVEKKHFDSPFYKDIEFLKELYEKSKDYHFFNQFRLSCIPPEYLTKEIIDTLCKIDKKFYVDAFMFYQSEGDLINSLKNMPKFEPFNPQVQSLNVKLSTILRENKEAWKLYAEKIDARFVNRLPKEIVDLLIINLSDDNDKIDLVNAFKKHQNQQRNFLEGQKAAKENMIKQQKEAIEKYFEKWNEEVRKLLPIKDLEFLNLMLSETKEGKYIRGYFFESNELQDFKYMASLDYQYTIDNNFASEINNSGYNEAIERKNLFHNLLIFELEAYYKLLVTYCDGYFLATDDEGIFQGCVKNIWELPLLSKERKLTDKYKNMCNNLNYSLNSTAKEYFKTWFAQKQLEITNLRKEKEKKFFQYIETPENKHIWPATLPNEILKTKKLSIIEKKIVEKGNHHYLSNRHFVSYEEYVFEITKEGFVPICLEISTLPYLFNSYKELTSYRNYCNKNLIAISAWENDNELRFSDMVTYMNNPELHDYWELLQRKIRQKKRED